MVSGGDTASPIEQRLRSAGVELPKPPTPLGSYVEGRRSGSWLLLSGMLPIVDGTPQHAGRLGGNLATPDGYDAARLACLNGLAAAREILGSLDTITSVVKLGVFIAAEPQFREHAKVADGASELLLLAFGRDRLPPRVVLGVVSLPLGLSVEVELVFEIDDSGRR